MAGLFLSISLTEARCAMEVLGLTIEELCQLNAISAPTSWSPLIPFVLA
jgi:hypothetical protein